MGATMRHRVKRDRGNGKPLAAIDLGTDQRILPTDMVLYIRDGMASIRTPEHDGGAVPDDFLILLGVATAWHDKRFRAMMKAVVRDFEPEGLYAGILSGG